MTRKLSFAMTLAAGAALLVPAASFAASPAAPAWNLHSLGTVDPDPCVGTYGIANCERGGGIAMEAAEGILVYVDGDTVVWRLTINGGSNWFGQSELRAGRTTRVPSLASSGGDVSVAYHDQGNNKVEFIHTFDFGTWSTPKGFTAPRQVTTDTAITVGTRTAVAAAGYDEVSQSRPGAAVRVKVFPASGTPKTTTFAWSGTGCGFAGTDPSLAQTPSGTLVLAYWQTCNKLVARRSTDGGASWSAAQTLSTGSHKLGTAMAAHGKTVVIAYTAGGRTLIRKSADAGKTWGAPVQAGSGATSLRLTYDGSRFNLLSGGTVSVIYRSSTNGTTWSAGDTVDTEAGSRTYALGVTYDGAPVAAWVMRGTDKVYDQWEATYQ